MIRSYIRVALRNLRKSKIFSVINIAGLAIGLTVFWLMSLYIADELSYDRASVNSDRIYRVAQTGSGGGGSFNLPVPPPPMGPALVKAFPEIEASARINLEGEALW